MSCILKMNAFDRDTEYDDSRKIVSYIPSFNSKSKVKFDCVAVFEKLIFSSNLTFYPTNDIFRYLTLYCLSLLKFLISWSLIIFVRRLYLTVLTFMSIMN